VLGVGVLGTVRTAGLVGSKTKEDVEDKGIGSGFLGAKSFDSRPATKIVDNSHPQAILTTSLKKNPNER